MAKTLTIDASALSSVNTSTYFADYFAGFTKGPRPASVTINSPMFKLYPQGKVVGGVIDE